MVDSQQKLHEGVFSNELILGFLQHTKLFLTKYIYCVFEQQQSCGLFSSFGFVNKCIRMSIQSKYVSAISLFLQHVPRVTSTAWYCLLLNTVFTSLHSLVDHTHYSPCNNLIHYSFIATDYGYFQRFSLPPCGGFEMKKSLAAVQTEFLYSFLFIFFLTFYILYKSQNI